MSQTRKMRNERTTAASGNFFRFRFLVTAGQLRRTENMALYGAFQFLPGSTELQTWNVIEGIEFKKITVRTGGRTRTVIAKFAEAIGAVLFSVAKPVDRRNSGRKIVDARGKQVKDPMRPAGLYRI